MKVCETNGGLVLLCAVVRGSKSYWLKNMLGVGGDAESGYLKAPSSRSVLGVGQNRGKETLDYSAQILKADTWAP